MVDHTYVGGLAWGDEGKGKVVDLLAFTGDFDVGVKFNGGANAGHTVNDGERTYRLHYIPATILHGIESFMSGGMVVSLPDLVEEIEQLRSQDVDINPENLHLSDRIHLTLPYHKLLEDAREEMEGGRVGTTRKGIGPTYESKASRVLALRLGDVVDRHGEIYEDIIKILEKTIRKNNSALTYYRSINPTAVMDEFTKAAEQIREFVVDDRDLIRRRLKDKKRFLFEAANGPLLSVDNGTYPYVSSSNGTVGAIADSIGNYIEIPVRIGVMKAHMTRVGEGPFPTEQDNEIGNEIRVKANEFGTTTGRPRRCGWFDAVAVRMAIELSDITRVVVTHMDSLAGLKTSDYVKIGVAYLLDGKEIVEFPTRVSDLERCRPVYEIMHGWSVATDRDSLSDNANNFVRRLEELLEVEIPLVGVGPGRKDFIRL